MNIREERTRGTQPCGTLIKRAEVSVRLVGKQDVFFLSQGKGKKLGVFLRLPGRKFDEEEIAIKRRKCVYVCVYIGKGGK